MDCADDDEDMELDLKVQLVRPNGAIDLVHHTRVWDTYVEEEGKIGNESKCIFFVATWLKFQAYVSEVLITFQALSKDGDGYDWGGRPYTHRKIVANLVDGENAFVERKAQSDKPTAGQGEYEIHYKIFKNAALDRGGKMVLLSDKSHRYGWLSNQQ